MRRYRRPPLSPATTATLARWTQTIRRARTPTTRLQRALKLWEEKRRLIGFQEVRERLVEMNAGLYHCMYCESDRGAVRKHGTLHATIEHWYPKRLDPLKTFDWNNLFLSCGTCNTTLKGENFPLDPHTGQPQLLHPVDDDPLQEIWLSPSTGAYTALPSSRGETTIRFFHLDQLDKQRRGVLEAYKVFILRYDQALQAADPSTAAEVKEILLALPFRGVLVRIFAMAQDPAQHILIGGPVATAISTHAMWTWV